MKKAPVFDIKDSHINISLGESLLQTNGEIHNRETFLLHINFIVSNLLSEYNLALDTILQNFENVRTNFKIGKEYRKEIRKDIDNAKKDIINNKTKILKDIDNIKANFLGELDNGKTYNETLLNIVNSVSDIIINNIKNFYIYFAGKPTMVNNKIILEQVEAIRAFYKLAFSKDIFDTISDIKKIINVILIQKNIVGNNESQNSDNVPNTNLLNSSFTEKELSKKIKDIENVINNVKNGINLFSKNYPDIIYIIYKRLQVAIESLSEMEKIQDINMSQEKTIQKQRQLIEDFKKIEQDYFALKKQNINDVTIIRDQKGLIKDLESQIKKLQQELEKYKKVGKNGQSNSLKGSQDDKNKKIEELEKDLIGSWEELENLKKEFDKEKSRLNDLTMKQVSENIKLQLTLEKAKKDKYREVEIFINNCEINFKDCSNDELLKYIFYGDCSENLKKDAVVIIKKFLDYFVSQITKGASSSTNHNDGVGGGKYSNNFINPIINFIKQKQDNMLYNDFLEEMIYINWQKIIEQYYPENDYIRKKQKIVKNMLSLFSNDCKSALPLFKALKYLADKLDNFDVGNSDLKILVSNIINTLDSNYVKNTINSRLITIAENIKEEKEKVSKTVK